MSHAAAPERQMQTYDDKLTASSNIQDRLILQSHQPHKRRIEWWVFVIKVLSSVLESIQQPTNRDRRNNPVAMQNQQFFLTGSSAVTKKKVSEEWKDEGELCQHTHGQCRGEDEDE